MKLRVDRHAICIVPESVQDEAYIEEVLGLKRQGDHAEVFRVNAMGLSCMAYVQIVRETRCEQLAVSVADLRGEG